MKYSLRSLMVVVTLVCVAMGSCRREWPICVDARLSTKEIGFASLIVTH
jgi:hypothetical protein